MLPRMKPRVYLLAIFVATLFLYFPILKTYFSADDFFHFKVAMFSGLGEFANFFKFLPFSDRGIAFYRPLFREVAFGIFYKLFGLNQIPVRTFQLVIHLLNTFLVYKLAKKIFIQEKIAIIASLFFALTSANIGVLYYLAGGIQASGATLFQLLSALLFLKYLVDKNIKYKLLTFIFYIAGLMAHEQAIVALPICVGLIWLKEKSVEHTLYKSIKELWLFALVTGIYLYLDFFVIGFSSGEVQYQANFGIATFLNTLSWYIVWSFGLPEMLVDFVGSNFSINPNLWKFWGNYFKVIFPAFFVSAAIVFFGIIGNFRKIVANKKVWFLVVWFLFALLPVLFLPIHKKTYYLAPALPAFCGLLGYIIFQIKKNYLQAFLITSLLVLSIITIKLSEKTYWAINRGKLAEKLISDIKLQYPSLSKGSVIYIKNDPNYPNISKEWGGSSTQAKQILSGSDAFQLIYNDPALRLYYEDDSKKPVGQFFEFTARLN